MSTCVSKSLLSEPQGIGMILGSECKRSYYAAAPLRRTLSADMSSKKWLSQNGVHTSLKKIASSEEFPIEKIEDELLDEKNSGDERSDIWSAIVSKIPPFSSIPAPPYVHPLVKQARSLSQKSLEVCTESLGSETGSDGFSSFAPSEASDGEREDEEEEVSYDLIIDKVEVSYVTRKSPPRSFPPPLPSLSHMKPHRKDGRLVLEAVPLPVPSQNYFHAERQGGRLLLTFVKPGEEIRKEKEIHNQQEDDIELDDQEEKEDIEEEIEKIEEKDERGIVLGVKARQPSPPRFPTGVINVHRSALMVNKLMGLTNMNPTWSSKLMVEVDDDEPTQLPQSVPATGLIGQHLTPQPATTMTTASSFNTYEYCWRTKPTSTAAVAIKQPQLSPMSKSYNNNNNNFFISKNQKLQDHQHLVVLRGDNGDYLVPVLKGCKEPRRTLLFWEPYCIPTS
ncbi:hypothetical protein GIB67_035377 [Kingdonia uniflora]|uniref:FAF domain-containing protein n=1 Tax=Kingdonia uniflora TaxID=39325 RepID=A0A7J7MMJ9_9MAGN|nr:hypothetical protein GIB67_035377 [Kingdonia uniflora]